MDMGSVVLGVIVWGLIFGAITAAIGQKKNFPMAESFLWGALLGIIGVIVMIVRRPGLPKPPPGMRAVKCPRCNAVGNRPETQPKYVCWQCKAAYHVGGTTPQN
jgi:DNA-directed RNA polymerase subunit RPC12/RpoP